MVIVTCYYILILTSFFLWMYVMILVLSLNDITFEPFSVPANEGNDKLPVYYKQFKWKPEILVMCFTMVFSYLWFIATSNLSCRFMIMCCVATYYFNSDDQGEGQAEVQWAMYMAHVNHLGTVAFGGLVLTAVSLIRVFFVWWAKKLQNKGDGNCFFKCISSISQCGLSCVEQLCDKISEDHFSWIAITGDDFCHGMWRGLMMKVRLLLEFQYSFIISDIFLSILKLTIIIMNFGTCYGFLKLTRENQNVTSMFAPLLLNLYLTYMTVSVFFSFFESASCTLTMCLAVD